MAEHSASVNAAGLELFQNFSRASEFVALSAIRVALVMRGKKSMGNSWRKLVSRRRRTNL